MSSLDDLLGGSDLPSYSAMTEDDNQEEEQKTKESRPLKEKFTEVTELCGPPHPWFDDENYYKQVLSDEGEVSVRMHTNLATFLKTKDPADKNIYKGRVTSTFWDLHKKIMEHVTEENFPLYKKLFLRYGALLPNLISPAHRQMLSTIFLDNRLDETVWYCDEWIKMVAEGEVNPLATDEAPAKKNDASAIVAKLKNQQEKITGSQEAMTVMLQNLNNDRTSLEAELKSFVDEILGAEESPLIAGVSIPYSDHQRQRMSDVNNVLKELSTLSKNLNQNYNKYVEEADTLKNISRQIKEANSGGNVVDTGVINQESGQIQALAKMCVGRQGNHFPLLASQYFSNDLKFIATRENVVKVMTEVEAIDVDIFKREFRRQINRVPPHVILIPCYGNSGACWEPYERHNKATSRGRIAVPLFPADLKVAVITALGMLRWETAKEMAAHYWMEEGITGQYYQWFTEQKMKGDLRASFVENYVLWITKESEGMQKLEREVRGIFWRTIPFSAERRESLKTRGFVYDELYKKDLNRQSSAGY